MYMKEKFVSDIGLSGDIMDYFIIKAVSIRIGSNKKPYMDLTLGDKTGEINGKKWDIQEDEPGFLNSLKEGELVRIKASVNEWNGVHQLKILRIRRTVKEDKLNMSDFIKAAPIAAEEMYGYITERADKITDPDLKAITIKFLTENKERLLYYPAAMRNHHAELGGLLYHMLRMLKMGEKACEVYNSLNKDWVVCGVILHDMEKLNEIESNELGISSGYSFEGKLLGHIVQGVKRIDAMALELGFSDEKRIMLEHMILAHHYEPEYGSPVRPMFIEAELLHYLDMLDAKIYDFEDNLSAVMPGSFTERVRTLDGRMLYKPSFASGAEKNEAVPEKQ